MMREANQSLRNRQESAAIHVPVSLNNVGPDNLAWFVEIASDHRRTTRRRMKTYLIKFSNREEGPYAETQMAQMFADGRVDRNTPCKPVDRGEWKTVDDYLPMLKYGTQLPPPTKVPAVPPMPPPVGPRSTRNESRLWILIFPSGRSSRSCSNGWQLRSLFSAASCQSFLSCG